MRGCQLNYALNLRSKSRFPELRRVSTLFVTTRHCRHHLVIVAPSRSAKVLHRRCRFWWPRAACLAKAFDRHLGLPRWEVPQQSALKRCVLSTSVQLHSKLSHQAARGPGLGGIDQPSLLSGSRPTGGCCSSAARDLHLNPATTRSMRWLEIPTSATANPAGQPLPCHNGLSPGFTGGMLTSR